MQVYSKMLESAEEGTIRISDFALVRSTSIPLRNYTTEVVTLWYRSPEVLMGGQYFAAVDVWSVGCVFAEMILGKPLFPGICEIDQLFQIFLKLGTPDEESWRGFSELPNYKVAFPNWRRRPLRVHLPTLEDAGLDLMARMLTVNPDLRITAEAALRHPYFDEVRDQRHRAAPAPEDADFPDTAQEPGSRDLNDACWALPRELDEPSCWRYARELQSQTSVGARTRQGLDDPMYLVRYLHYLKCLESKMYPLKDYMAPPPPSSSSSGSGAAAAGPPVCVQSDLLPVHRSMLVDWLVEVIDVFEMSVRTVFMAVNYTDRFLALEKVERRRFQLLGATCLHIASKCEDVSYIGVEDLVVCADKVYKPEDVLQLEEHVLNALDFRICVPTAIDFLNVFTVRLCYSAEEDARCTVRAACEGPQPAPLPLMPVPDDVRSLAQYLAELTLQEHQFISRLPSLVAASCLVLALYYRDVPISQPRIKAVTGYSLQDMRECIKLLRKVHDDARFRSQLLVILRRYLKPERHEVANIESKPSLAALFDEAEPAPAAPADGTRAGAETGGEGDPEASEAQRLAAAIVAGQAAAAEAEAVYTRRPLRPAHPPAGRPPRRQEWE